jgi:hypothetical protein
MGVTLAMVAVFVAVGGLGPNSAGHLALAQEDGTQGSGKGECVRTVVHEALERGERPGHGHGDKNHSHIGPPGQICRTQTITETQTETETETRTETETETETEDETRGKGNRGGGKGNRGGGQGQPGGGQGGEGRRGGR